MSIHQALKSSGTGRVNITDRSNSATADSVSNEVNSAQASINWIFNDSGSLSIASFSTAFPSGNTSNEGNAGLISGEWCTSCQNIYSIRVAPQNENQVELNINNSNKTFSAWHKIENTVSISVSSGSFNGTQELKSGNILVQIAHSSDTSRILDSATYTYFVRATSTQPNSGGDNPLT